MVCVNKQECLKHKKSDTLCIMGSGWSINTITGKQWNWISKHDSIGMNWFCHKDFPTTWYLVREQCTNVRIEEGGTLTDFLRMINNLNPFLLVKLKERPGDIFAWSRNLDKLKCTGMAVGENREIFQIKGLRDVDFSVDGLVHFKCSMTDIFHFALNMGYKEIVFFGVDLYNCAYFWLPETFTRPIVAARRATVNSPHKTKDVMVRLVCDLKKYYPDLSMKVHNPKSVLAKHIEVL